MSVKDKTTTADHTQSPAVKQLRWHARLAKCNRLIFGIDMNKSSLRCLLFGSGNWSHAAIHLVVLVVLVLVGATATKKPKAPSFRIRSGWNLAGMYLEWIRIAWRSRTSDMTSHFQDGGHDVISRKARRMWRQWLATCTWSMVHSYLFRLTVRNSLYCAAFLS